MPWPKGVPQTAEHVAKRSAAVTRSVANRFWPNVLKTKTCWIWTGAENGHGYGQIHIQGRGPMTAHRVSWMLKYGDVPDVDLHHTCATRLCVRPLHLVPIARVEHTKLHKKGATWKWHH